MASRKFKRVRWNQTDRLRCPLCFRSSGIASKTLDSGYLDVMCSERCGAFEIEDSLARKFVNLSVPDRGLIPYLRCHVRQKHERKGKARISEENWRTLAEERRSRPFKCRWKRFLALLARREESCTGIAEIDPEVDRLLVDTPLPGKFEVLVSYLVRQGDMDRKYVDSDDEWLPNLYTLTGKGLSKDEDLPQDQRFTSTDEKHDQVSERPRSGKTGPKPIADSHYLDVFSVLRQYGQSDEWADERNLKTVCRQLDEKKIPTPTGWQRVEKLPGSWKDSSHSAKTWSEALKHGGKEPVKTLIRSRQEEARKRANSPR